MGKLKVLPANIANLIAAGEVVQRPSSVVKELMENAVDAGASGVSVVVTDAGRTRIQVIDDGCGMGPADAVLCFERHATSKIASASDLEAIRTFGFRGEALPSIAAVSEVTLKTRRKGDEIATQVKIDGSGNASAGSASAPEGTSISVRNLFYNTPARRKFLKSDNVELRHIIEEFTRVALTRPETAFSLVSNGKDIFQLKSAKSLKYRILDLIGSSVASDIVDIDITTSLLRITGFVGRPDTARKSLGNQFLFVNGRFFKSAYIHKAVMKAYEDLIPQGVTPSYFLFLETDPQSVDVNVSPTKTEIKFEDESLVFQTVYACVKEVLGQQSFGASIDFDTSGAVELPQLGRSFEEYRGVSESPAAVSDPLYNPFDPETPLSPDYSFDSQSGSERGYSGFSGPVDRRQDYGMLFEQNLASSPRLLVIKGRYVVVPAASGMMVVNVKRARERILYEKFLKALSGGENVSQKALFPVQVQIGAAQMPLIEGNSDILKSLGFDISSFGTDTVVVNAVPQGYSCEQGKVEQMVSDVLLILSEDSSALPQVLCQNLASKFAKLGSLSGDDLTSEVEAQRLIDSLFACDNSELTAGGRRIVAIIDTQEIEKKF